MPTFDRICPLVNLTSVHSPDGVVYDGVGVVVEHISVTNSFVIVFC
jgi:hypothetical protein